MSRCWVIYTYINQQQQPSMKGFTKAWTSLKNILFDQTPLVLACVTDNLPEKSDRPFPNLNLMMSVQNSEKYLNLYHLLVLLHKNSKVLKYYSGHCKKKKKTLQSNDSIISLQKEGSLNYTTDGCSSALYIGFFLMKNVNNITSVCQEFWLITNWKCWRKELWNIFEKISVANKKYIITFLTIDIFWRVDSFHVIL